MKAEIAKEWAIALRSGQYKQAKKQLQEDGGFCCLGVLCELAVAKGIVNWGDDEVDHRDTTLPTKVMEWAEMKNRDGEYSKDLPCLWKLNDDLDKSFNELADIIEKEYVAL